MKPSSAAASLLLRWGRFNLVGVLGMVLQLVTLALLNRTSGGHFLLATAAAVELTLLHNFVWHLHYTWLDRVDQLSVSNQLVRFHLSNGLVSLAGNLLLMRILVQEARIPILPANLLAILACSLVNFTLGHCWVFPARAGTTAR
ncbi:MAG TPA: GtrA family protein [Terracidiphilus sp.]|nr:GtrA family protein [Terracidiphilus sp.]